MNFFDDGLNPKFVFHSAVAERLLDARGVLAHVERAIAAGFSKADDEFVVRDMRIELLGAVAGPSTMRIDVWVEDLADDTCVYGFLVSSEDGRTPYARGDRTIRNIRTSWTLPFRAHHATFHKDLPAYA